MFISGVGIAVSEDSEGLPLSVESTASVASSDISQGSTSGGTRILITGEDMNACSGVPLYYTGDIMSRP